MVSWELPDSTAVRVALWRALHVEADAPPPVFDDVIGLKLAAPDENWRSRPDMDVQWTKIFRAAIVARARFIEDLMIEQAARGVSQYVILGAGLDTFAQRRPEIAAQLTVFEIDRPGPQMWKRKRLAELGFGVPDRLRLVPVDFEAGDFVVAKDSSGRLRHQPARCRGFDRRQHVSHQSGERGDAARGRRRSRRDRRSP